MGSGTTAVAAIKNQRNFVGYDTNSDYIKLAYQRIESCQSDARTLFPKPEEVKSAKAKPKGYSESVRLLKSMAEGTGAVRQ
jgi:DNA modification methylase